MGDLPVLVRKVHTLSNPDELGLVRFDFSDLSKATNSHVRIGNTVLKSLHLVNREPSPAGNTVFGVDVQKHELVTVFRRILRNHRKGDVKVESVVEKVFQDCLDSV